MARDSLLLIRYLIVDFWNTHRLQSLGGHQVTGTGSGQRLQARHSTASLSPESRGSTETVQCQCLLGGRIITGIIIIGKLPPGPEPTKVGL
eukprot:342278-Rhodomonas_salina.1